MQNNLRVPVLSITGKPLMPTKPSRARKWIKQGKAKIVKNDLQVFIIQLTYKTETENTQSISIGVDPGSSFTGIAAQSKLATHLGFNLDLPRKKVTKRMEERAMMRNARRSRRIKRSIPFKLRNHRQKRFNNRKGLEIVPSIKSSKQLELRIISEISRILPITHCVIEKITIYKSKGFTRAQQGNNWLIKQLIIRFPFLKISELKGYQTFNLRNHLKLSKSKDKAARDASAHVNDAIALACSVFRSYQKNNITKSADYIGKLQLTKFQFKCVSRLNTRPHKLHHTQFKKGKFRLSYGGFKKLHNFHNGDYIKYESKKKLLLGYIQANDLYNFVSNNWIRIKISVRPKNTNLIRNSCNLILS